MPHVAYALLIRAPNGVLPGQWISTKRSRGNDIIEIDFVSGSARTSMIVSERDVVSLPLTGALVVADHERRRRLAGQRRDVEPLRRDLDLGRRGD